MQAGRSKIRHISRVLLSLFFLVGGINHFVNPEFYLPLIPNYIPFHGAVNWLSGLAEVALGMGLFWPKTRRVSALAIIALMVAFIPSHVFFIQIGGCVEEGLCTPMWVAWLRLLVIHPLLILWAWWSRK